MSKELKLLIREDLVTKSGKTRIEFLIYFEGKQYLYRQDKVLNRNFGCKNPNW